MGELIASIAAHAVLGTALAALVWSLGLGWLRLVRTPATWLAYPVGLLAGVLAAWLVLVSPWLLPAALLAAAPAVLGAGRTVLAAALRAAPFALGLGVALGLLLHGPTVEEDSHAYGDLLFYAAKLASARESVIPFRDLLVLGESSTYVEAGSTFLGAALPAVDPILFQAATMPAFLVAALAVGFALRGTRTSGWEALALAPLAVAVVAYPTWITESPPVALALPLAFSLYTLAHDRLGAGEIAAGLVAVGVSFALTKGFGAVSLAVAAAFALAGARGRVDTRRALAYGAPVVAIGGAALVFFVLTSGWLTEVLDVKFLPADALDGALDQLDRRDTQSAAPALVVVGQLLLAAALARARAWPAFAFLVVAAAGNWLVGGHGFDITVGIAVVISLLIFLERPDVTRAQLPLVAAAGSALALSCVFRDISGLRAGVVFALLLGGGVLAAFSARRAYVAVAAAVVVAVALVSPAGLTDAEPTLFPEDEAIWAEVRAQVPQDGLVFTSETGPVVDGRQGWNYYPGVAGRQVFLSGWSSSPLLVDPAERRRRLRLNRDVLEGRRDPRAVAPGHDSYFAVVDASAREPAGARERYANDAFALYELP